MREKNTLWPINNSVPHFINLFTCFNKSFPRFDLTEMREQISKTRLANNELGQPHLVKRGDDKIYTVYISRMSLCSLQSYYQSQNSYVRKKKLLYLVL